MTIVVGVGVRRGERTRRRESLLYVFEERNGVLKWVVKTTELEGTPRMRARSLNSFTKDVSIKGGNLLKRFALKEVE